MLTLLLLCLPADGLADDLKKLAPDLSRPDSFKNESARVRDGLRAANAASTKLWDRMQRSDEPRKLLDAPLKALAKSLSSAPADLKPAPLQLEVRRTLAGDGHTVALITFRSRFGLVVTANLYSPPKPGKSMPGLVLVHSHHNPKTEGELQDMGMMWARAGCHVLVLDLLGHGERRQHPFATAKDYPKEFRTSRQDYWFRHHSAIQLQTAGESLMGWMAADISAAVSVLLEQPGIDRDKIAVLGAVAGGGDPAAVAAALDERIKAAVVFNFGGPQPESRYPLPDDAEATFNYAGGGSWETTRNLAYSARDGFLPWVIVAGIGPRKLIHAHEFSWDVKRDPVWKRLTELWKKNPDDLKSARGFGTLTGKGAEAGSHCNNIGAVHRKDIHAAFRQWWGVAAEEPKERKRRPGSDLLCLGPKESIAPARGIARTLASKHGLPADRDKLRERWAALLNVVDIKAREVTWDTLARVGAKQYTAAIPGEDGHITLLVPGKGKRPLTVLCGQGGAKELLAKRAEEIAALIAKDEAVAVVDLGGTANLPPGNRGRNSGSTSLAASSLMLGRPLLGERLRVLRTALAVLRGRDDIDAAKIRLWGDSTAAANTWDDTLVRPLEHEQPPHAEPVGPHVVLLAALFEDGITEVRARGGLASWKNLLDGAVAHFPYDNVVPGSALADWPAVCEAVKIPVRLEGPLDGLNRPIKPDAAKKLYAAAKNVTIVE